MPLASPDRPMATIAKILNVAPIAGADRIELYTVYGWNVVDEKDKYREGDLCVYVVIDSVFPENFLRAQFLGGKPLKTRFMRGVYSQGLIFPLSWLAEERQIDISLLKENDNVTDIIGIKKWISQDEATQYDDTDKKNLFPSYVPKTDEPRIQNNPKLLTSLIGNEIVITRKEDGCSATYVFNAETNEFLICSRNYIVSLDKSTAHYFNMNELFNIETKMKQLGRSIAIQGEIVGPLINGNKLKLTNYDFRVFNIYDIEKQTYVSTTEMMSICEELKLNTVPILYLGGNDARTESVQSLLIYAESIEYNKGCPAEGIVVKTNTCSPRTSFKVISNKYLMKHKL